MGDESQRKIIEEVCERLEASQEMVEKAAFDTINQQDKVIQMVSSSMTHMMGLLSKFEMIGLELEAATITDDETQTAPLQRVNEMIAQDFIDIEEFSTMYQMMMEQQDVLSEVIHGMEFEIANHRDSMELAKELLLKDV